MVNPAQLSNTAVLLMSWEPSKRSLWITVIHLICVNPAFVSCLPRSGHQPTPHSVLLSTFKGDVLSLSFEETADRTSSSACSWEPDAGFPAFAAAGRSRKDGMTLLGRDAGVSALCALREGAHTVTAAEFTNMHRCALCRSRTHRGIR